MSGVKVPHWSLDYTKAVALFLKMNKEPDIENRFIAYLNSRADIEDLDQKDFPGEKADFSLESGSIILELKTIKSNPKQKIDKFIFDLEKRDEYPLFFGERPLEKILQHFPDAEQLNFSAFDKLTKQIERALEKADKQVLKTKEHLGKPDAAGVVILLNDRISDLRPDQIAARASFFLRKRKDGETRYKNITSVIVLSETHTLDGAVPKKKTLPIIRIDAPNSLKDHLLQDRLRDLFSGWAGFNGASEFHWGAEASPEDLNFSKVEPSERDFNGQITRQELWRREYRNNRYLSYQTENQFIDTFNRVFTLLCRFFIKDQKPPEEVDVREVLEDWTHCLEEAEIRNLDLKKVGPKPPP